MSNVAVQNRRKIYGMGKSEGALRLCASGFVQSSAFFVLSVN